MTARILDGNALSAKLRGELAARAATLTAQGVQPCLAVILVGGDPASAVYVRNKVAGCEKAGIKSLKYEYPQDAAPADVLGRIAALNADPAVHGILVQLPLPPQFDEKAVLEAISVEKDVDGFHAENVGRLSQGQDAFVPCTPNGVMEMLKSENVPLRGATVTVCHSATRDLAFHTRRADILVAAVGRPRFVTGDMVRAGAVVIDVGINRVDDASLPKGYKLVGDVAYAEVAAKASAITPVPGGVGPMTIAMLLANTLQAVKQSS